MFRDGNLESVKIKRLFAAVLLSIALVFSCSACAFVVTDANPMDTGIVKPEQQIEPLGDEAEIHFIDVGQGDSTLIIVDDEAMLIDCGDNDYGSTVKRYLENQGIDELEFVIGTHPDADHIGGMDVVLYNFECETILMPAIEADTRTYDDVIQTMKSKNYTVTYPQVGDVYTIGDEARFTIIAPNSYDYGDNTNDYSIGLIFEYGQTKFMFTGDAEYDAEADIIDNGLLLKADVFKAGHHGSSNASCEELLDLVQPKYAVISCGADNKYGHPHDETMARFAERNIEVYRTDTQGSIVAYTDGVNISFSQGSIENNMVSTDNSGSITYILNTNSKKYHLPDCSGAENISEKNKEETSLSAGEIEAAGYEPCGICKP